MALRRFLPSFTRLHYLSSFHFFDLSNCFFFTELEFYQVLFVLNFSRLSCGFVGFIFTR